MLLDWQQVIDLKVGFGCTSNALITDQLNS